jgi:SPW repeat-containing protein
MTTRVHGTAGQGHVDTRGLHVLALGAGLWFAISPAVYDAVPSSSNLWNHVVCGVTIGLAALIGLVWTNRLAHTRWICGAFGVWILMSPWIFRYTDSWERTINSVAVGLFLVYCALWGAALRHPA